MRYLLSRDTSKPCLSIIVILAFTFGTLAEARAQAVRTIKKPLSPGGKYDTWTISYSRVGSSEFEFDSERRSEAAADSRIAELRAWSRSMSSGSDWKLETILVEVSGEGDSVDETLDAAARDSFLHELGSGERGLIPNVHSGQTLQEYAKVVSEAYRRAVEARRYLTRRTQTILQSEFSSMNRTISDFNALRTEAIQKTKSDFKSYPPVRTVSIGEMRGKLIREVPKLQWVDVTMSYDALMSKNTEIGNSLKGKRAEGRLGNVECVIDFSDDGSLKISELKSNGKQIATARWEQSGDEILFSTDAFFYRGKVSADAVEGTRIAVKQHRLETTPENWSANFKSPEPKPGEKHSPDVDLTGVWIARTSQHTFTYEFYSDGRFTLGIKHQYFSSRKNGEWKSVNGEIDARFVDSGAAGTGGFSKGAPVSVRVVSANELEIDGAIARRSN